MRTHPKEERKAMRYVNNSSSVFSSNKGKDESLLIPAPLDPVPTLMYTAQRLSTGIIHNYTGAPTGGTF